MQSICIKKGFCRYPFMSELNPCKKCEHKKEIKELEMIGLSIYESVKIGLYGPYKGELIGNVLWISIKCVVCINSFGLECFKMCYPISKVIEK